jgi:hypothetical protein
MDDLSLSPESEKIRRRTYRTEICSSLLPILPHPLDAETDFTTSYPPAITQMLCVIATLRYGWIGLG